MVETRIFDTPQSAADALVGQIILRPNCSLGWRATVYFLAIMMALSFTIGLAFTLQGLWLVLPFTGIEMGVLTISCYWVVRRGYTQEVLEFWPHEVTLEGGHARPEWHRRWQRFYTKVCIEPPRNPWHPVRIYLQHRGETIEIGQFLSQAEKSTLIRDLQTLVDLANRRQSHLARDDQSG